MDAEERTRNAIIVTRNLLQKALTSPFTLAVMTAENVNPNHVEDKVFDILCYLEKTSPTKSPEDLGIDTIKENNEEISFREYLETFQTLEGTNRMEEYTEEELARMHDIALKVAEGLQRMRDRWVEAERSRLGAK